jgi:UDP-N-acetylglucosamine 4,6-dehydratase
MIGLSVLITGGTGSFGNAFVRRALVSGVRRVIVFSRDEWKQGQMAERIRDDRVRFFLGDVRDKTRLQMALRDVDIVVHAAALKQVPAGEYNPSEFVQTNVLGAVNVLEAAVASGVRKVLALSTDKAVGPVNLYGASKLCSEKLFVAANAYTGLLGHPLFSVVRYGNIAGSRGSVIPKFREAIESGKAVHITDDRMTRFWMTQEQACDLVVLALREMHGGEVFLPILRSFRLLDLALAMGAQSFIRVGIRPGEKIHETLYGVDEARQVRARDGYFVLLPAIAWTEQDTTGVPVEPAAYTSETAPRMTQAELADAVERIG